ncbi:hypothetical protein E1286_24115 [Nonomuraea terrae]|uniref:Uncharacterized protein n=1 Tax=Nonomuraea terrae TaxID=2530383 RepID=A0A4R4YKJ1_9ACTN|nr:hypothetical protein [Nonomuraea terrae]TDD45406.1 hypothetical protein E1286_24115 [Nonomuraea terrae]
MAKKPPSPWLPPGTPLHLGVPLRRRQPAHHHQLPEGLLMKWIVRLVEQRIPYGPFDDEQEARRFADFLTTEVDPAAVEPLRSPTTELLNWRDATQERAARPSVRGGPDIGHDANRDYFEEQGT